MTTVSPKKISFTKMHPMLLKNSTGRGTLAGRNKGCSSSLYEFVGWQVKLFTRISIKTLYCEPAWLAGYRLETIEILRNHPRSSFFCRVETQTTTPNWCSWARKGRVAPSYIAPENVHCHVFGKWDYLEYGDGRVLPQPSVRNGIAV